MYAALDVKTNFSFLRGASSPEELIERAAELELSAIALCDWDGVYGIPKAYWKKKIFPQLKLLCGASLALEGQTRLLLLASNRASYGLLCRLLTASHAGKEKGKASLSWTEFLSIFHSHPGQQGLFALAALDANLSLLTAAFSSERLYLSLPRFLDGEDHKRTEQALWLRQRWDLKLVATNEVHYHLPGRKRLQDALTAVREGVALSAGGHKLFSNGERYLKSPAEMQRLFHDLPEALAATMEIAEQCTFCPSELRYRYPSEWIPASHTANSYLRTLVAKGAQERYPKGVPETVRAQLEHELALIEKLGFADYFLTIYDIIDFARQKDILFQGRGSAANSVVCYCLGITAIDPLRMNLLFERFLSAERNEPPDIDVDFEHERREEVLQYVYEKYGRDRAAMVSAVITYRGRSAFRELSKALGVNVGTLSAKKLEKAFVERASSLSTPAPRALIEELAKEMKGFPRHLSIHSGGFTLSADPILEIVPVEPARKEGRTIIQWDKYDLDFLGLLKVDILSLGMLTAIQRSLKILNLKLHELPPEDPATYAMIQNADTVGTFQIESRAQMSMLGRLLPKTFYDLVVQVAIVRPGPIVGKMVHPYLRRRQGKEKVDFPHPKLKEILGKTLGVPLFQEQVMKMAIELGGFTPGEADELRRAIGAWRSEGSIEKMGRRLIEGLRRTGFTAEYAERIFQQIQGFAQYGFPESHAASFALLAYASSYLKCHHPAAFTCGLLNAQPMGFYAAHTLVDDAKRHGVKVAPVHPNHSEWESEVIEGVLQLGWNRVRGIHRKEVDALLEVRPFCSLADFLQRAPLRKDTLLRLALGGTFTSFGHEAREALWMILHFCHATQGELFQPTIFASEARFPALGSLERIQEEYAAFSLSTHAHPMQALRQILPLPKLHTQTAKKQPHGRNITVAGLILVRQRPPTAKGMTFSTLEDEFGFLDIAIPPQAWERVKDVFLEHSFLEVRGVLQKESNSFSVMVSQIRSIWRENPQMHIEPVQYFH